MNWLTKSVSPAPSISGQSQRPSSSSKIHRAIFPGEPDSLLLPIRLGDSQEHEETGAAGVE